MYLEAFLKDLPKLHNWTRLPAHWTLQTLEEGWNTGGFDSQQMRVIHDFIVRNCPASPAIIETGAGNSTICFLHLNPSKLTSIAPDRALFDRIIDYCNNHHIDPTALDVHVSGSEWALPKIAMADRDRYDFALIDGLHNWPTVMVDFYYMNYLVKQGGFIMLDDVHLHSVKELARLLALDVDNFRLRLNLGKTLAFEKISVQRELGEFFSQPYVMQMTDTYRHYPVGLGLWRIKPLVWLSLALTPGRHAVRLLRRLVRGRSDLPLLDVGWLRNSR
jgi:Methyltransferase domain